MVEVAQLFDSEPGGTVQGQEEAEDEAWEVTAAVGPQQDQKQVQTRQREVELRRVDAVRPAQGLARKRSPGKADADTAVGGYAEAAAVQVAADAGYENPQGKRGNHGVGQLPDRPAPNQHHDEAADHRQKHASQHTEAVEPLPEGDGIQPFSTVLLHVGQHVEEPRAHDGGHHDHYGQVGQPGRIYAQLPPSDLGQLQTQEEGDGQHQAVALYGKRSDVKEIGMHGSPLECAAEG